MHDAITIERLDTDSPHVPIVARWTFETWGQQLHPGRTFAEAVEETRLECGERGVPSLFVALANGVAVGTASLIAEDISSRPELAPWLASVFVLPQWRGRGIASRLVQRVEQEAFENGIKRFYLYTPDQQALYRRLGWQDLEQLTYGGETVTIMSRQLTAERD
ncbi:GNAT family N-acetyltransferase [Vreelandella populi]|uniref:N-acetyltransferase n=1 Tax=Vreelandella populi TaxID=2498858 RepID=A0A433LFW8_9GAMM|nr:GNAT family N-acetyltransferase [Halomonas populi]RUR37930.1 N-acetyltransferase [Halomonas populi]RUR48908.1 N-acetyltransferase [Halomonas populi]RUR55252.1 N-acetyltransferase [Halomonas populi]